MITLDLYKVFDQPGKMLRNLGQQCWPLTSTSIKFNKTQLSRLGAFDWIKGEDYVLKGHGNISIKTK